jgi:hypothetical protein
MTYRESGVRDFSEEQDQPLAPGQQQMTDTQKEEFLRKAREMILIREQKARTAKREGELKPGLMDELELFGDPYGASGQHRTIEFPTPIRKIARFVRQTKVVTEVNETEAEAIARQRGIYDRLFKPVMTLDEGAVMVALREELLTEEDVAAMFPKKTTYAFIAEKSK